MLTKHERLNLPREAVQRYPGWPLAAAQAAVMLSPNASTFWRLAGDRDGRRLCANQACMDAQDIVDACKLYLRTATEQVAGEPQP